MNCSSPSYSASFRSASGIPAWMENVCRGGSFFYAQYSSKTVGLNPANLLKPTKKINHIGKYKNLKKPLLSNKNNLHKNQLTLQENPHCETNEESISDKFSGEVIEIHLLIHPENAIKKSDEDICESLLGFSTKPFSDGIRLMVSQYKMNSLLCQRRCVTTGDCFKSLNGFEISSNNIENVLLQFKKPSVVCLRFERIFEDKINLVKNNIKVIPSYETLINLTQHSHESSIYNKNDEDIMFSLVIVPIAFVCDDTISNDAIFSYPENNNNNIFNIRGCFLTLYSILKSQLTVEPIETKIYIGSTDYFVSYICHGNVLLLISISLSCMTAKEAQLKIYDIVQYFQSCYQMFDKTIKYETKTHLYKMCEIIEIYLRSAKNIYLFEEILQQSHLINLPQKTQQEIFEALNEMGAMDYRDWNDTPLNAHREFFICGCALYFESYLLNSQLLSIHLSKIESFLRCSGVFDFIKNHTINDFIYWKEMPLESGQRRNFLLICTRNNLTLAVLLQEHYSGRALYTEEKVKELPLFYIEEIQETLDHLRYGGIEYLAEFWTARYKIPIICKQFLPAENLPSFRLGDAPILKKSSGDARISIRETAVTDVPHFETPKNDDSDLDWDGFGNVRILNNNIKCRMRDYSMTALKKKISKKITDNLPVSIYIGEKNLLIYYVQIDFGSALIITPPNELSGFLVQEFKSACHLIHTIFENTKRQYKQLPGSKISNSNCSTLTLVRDHAILIHVQDNNGMKSKFWTIGKLFLSTNCELYVCHKSEGQINLEEIAFRLSFVISRNFK